MGGLNFFGCPYAARSTTACAPIWNLHAGHGYVPLNRSHPCHTSRFTLEVLPHASLQRCVQRCVQLQSGCGAVVHHSGSKRCRLQTARCMRGPSARTEARCGGSALCAFAIIRVASKPACSAVQTHRIRRTFGLRERARATTTATRAELPRPPSGSACSIYHACASNSSRPPRLYHLAVDSSGRVSALGGGLNNMLMHIAQLLDMVCGGGSRGSASTLVVPMLADDPLSNGTGALPFGEVFDFQFFRARVAPCSVVETAPADALLAPITLEPIAPAWNHTHVLRWVYAAARPAAR
eukprot:6634791-Prymnesium_polylepis.1